MLRQLVLAALLGFSAGLPAGVGHGGGAGGAGGVHGVGHGAVLGVAHGVGHGGVLGAGHGLGGYGGANFAPAKYDFGYNVNAPQYGTNFGHSESRDGAFTRGEYKVNLPDGRIQTVTYHVDNWGYHPVVSYTGVAQFPARVSPLLGGVFGGVGGVGGVVGVGGGRGAYH